MFVHATVLLAVLASCLSQEYPPDLCCMPAEYEGFIGEVGMEGQVYGQPTAYTALYAFSFSSVYNAVHWTFSLDLNFNRDTVLIDFTPEYPVTYTTYKDGTCVSKESKERIATGCESEMNDRMIAYYKGMPQNTFSAFSQTDMSVPDYARSYIWDTDCSLLHSTVTYQGSDNKFGAYTNVFMNMTTGISDGGVFTPPDPCTRASADHIPGDIGLGPMKSTMNIVPMK